MKCSKCKYSESDTSGRLSHDIWDSPPFWRFVDPLGEYSVVAFTVSRTDGAMAEENALIYVLTVVFGG
jgi:hypothetical protein